MFGVLIANTKDNHVTTIFSAAHHKWWNKTYQSSPDLKKNETQRPILIEKENRAFIYRHPHWHNHQELKKQTNKNRNDKNLDVTAPIRIYELKYL